MHPKKHPQQLGIGVLCPSPYVVPCLSSEFHQQRQLIARLISVRMPLLGMLPLKASRFTFWNLLLATETTYCSSSTQNGWHIFLFLTFNISPFSRHGKGYRESTARWQHKPQAQGSEEMQRNFKKLLKKKKKYCQSQNS